MGLWRLVREVSKDIVVKIKCPICGREELVRIPLDELQNAPSGVVRREIMHNVEEPHAILVCVDKHGSIRGTYIIRHRRKESHEAVKSAKH